MPIYEYECQKCGHQTEAMQKFSDPPIAECKMCHGKMRKLISQSAFHLKGTGWYVTDYASKSRSGPASESSSKSEQDQGKTSKADTESPKTEAKGSTKSSGKKDSSDSKSTTKSNPS